jgi:dihydrofolate synthase/folylpolyglutamate synthase
VETFTALYGSGGILLFGCAAGKNAAAMAEVLLPHFSRCIITTPGVYKISEPERVFAAFQAHGDAMKNNAGELTFIKDTKTAIGHTLDMAARLKLPVLVTGSFYLAAEVRAGSPAKNFAVGSQAASP